MPYTHRLHPNRLAIAEHIARDFDGNTSAVARRAGLSPGGLHDILSGRRTGRSETLEALASALGVDVDDITDPVTP